MTDFITLDPAPAPVPGKGDTVLEVRDLSVDTLLEQQPAPPDPYAAQLVRGVEEHHADVDSIYDVLINDMPLKDVVAPCPDIGKLICAPATIHLAGA